jgi:hypothetical protein
MPYFLNQHPALVALAFIAYFVLLWCAIGFSLSLLGGWRELAKTYRTERPFPPRALRLRSGAMRRGIGYHSVLTLGSDAEGLYLGVFLLFRLGHPRLFIPWNQVSVGQVGKRLFLPIQTLRLGSSRVPLTIRPRLVQQLLPRHP